MKDFREEETHESWGMIGAYKCQGECDTFFQSDVPCYNYIKLVIKTARKQRGLSKDWVHGDKIVCEVKLTPNQWVEMLTNMNYCDGVPCTFTYTEKLGSIDFKPESNRLDLLIQESDEKVDEGKEKLELAIKKVISLVNEKRISKKIADEFLGDLEKANSCLSGGGIEFVKRQAKEHIENMTVQAKSNIASYIDYKIYTTGLKELEKLRIEGDKHNEND